MEEKNHVITSEQAFDLLPYVVDIYDKLNMDAYRKELQKKYKDKKVDEMEVGIEVVKYVIKNAGKIKDEFFAIVSIIENRSVEDVKRQPFIQTILAIQKIFMDPDLMGFFKQDMK